MKIVIDTSVIIAVVTNEEHKQALINKTKGAHLIAPLSPQFEIGNALSAMFKRNKMTLEQARKVGKVLVKRKDGTVFVIKPIAKNDSPLDVPGVDINLSRNEIVDLLREVRQR